ncbi:MAG: hypothetical protein A2X86_07305 [Bdellovibrionales bacterium GWA2_49_15]|nr:MAG: hypothetical protein A2X86_07305 [Bdellovibrionales bacterium GWA2_49_15]HAZ11916.1 hypothetical protein [Bdellovibrionales bacterium]
MVRLFGFTLLRNGIKYDYSFRESLGSLASVCEKTYLALGASEDGTEDAVGQLGGIEIIPTVWDEKSRQGGVILSEQTNIALNHLRTREKTTPEAWGFYLQADEVLHEDDFALIRSDLEKAHAEGADAVAFRYLHFWQTHRQLAINKKWYPQEIRAIKLDSALESWGDAQGFRPAQKIFYSDARIFHYGHVREAESYKIKKQDILKLYHSDSRLPKYQKREKRFDAITEVIAYLGTHPKFMKERIIRLENFWIPEKQSRIFIAANPALFSSKLVSQILVEQIEWCSNPWKIPLKEWSKVIIPFPSRLQKVFYSSRIPLKMRSKLALPWPPDFLLTLKLSEKGIGLLPLH